MADQHTVSMRDGVGRCSCGWTTDPARAKRVDDLDAALKVVEAAEAWRDMVLTGGNATSPGMALVDAVDNWRARHDPPT